MLGFYILCDYSLGLEICKKYNVTDAEEFVDTWMAYSVSHLQGENPTFTNLSKFEREEFSKKPKEFSRAFKSSNKSSPIIYGGSANKERYVFLLI